MTDPADVWRGEALCRQGRYADMAPVERVQIWVNDHGDYGEAYAVCRRCPVRVPCIESTDGLYHAREVHGVWGGFSYRELRAFYRLRRRAGHGYSPECGCDYCGALRAALEATAEPELTLFDLERC